MNNKKIKVKKKKEESQPCFFFLSVTPMHGDRHSRAGTSIVGLLFFSHSILKNFWVLN
jgi:hypothetical protein